MVTKFRRRKDRRALSTVVGAVFMIIVMTSALNVTLWTMRQQDRVTETVIEKTNTSLNRLNEDIEISSVKMSNGKLNLTVSNPGGAASYLKTIYVVNETSNQQYKYDLDLAVDGREVASGIGQSNPAIVIRNDTTYSVKVISQSGTAATTTITSLSAVALPMTLYVIPPTIVPENNVTLLFAVTNNLTDSDLAFPVQPTLGKDLSCGPPYIEGCEFFDYGIEPEAAYIPRGTTMLFKWVYGIKSPDATIATFNASLVGAKPGNFVIERGLLQILKPSQISIEEVVVGNNLLAKPEVFIVAPGPFGETGGGSVDKGYWGIVVANPVDITMKITQITINVFSSETDASHKPLEKGCNIVGITPTSGWTCPHGGTMRWRNPASPIYIKPYEAYTFLAKASPGSINDNEPALLISVTAFTSLGQFAKQGYATNMFNGIASIMNIYLTDTKNNVTAYADSPTNHILGNITMQSASKNNTIYVAVGDFETTNNAASKMLSGAVLIINVPKNFTDIIIPSYIPGFETPVNKTFYSDGTTQIRAKIKSNVGDVAGKEAAVFYFNVTAPTVVQTKTYVMHTFLEGLIDTDSGGSTNDFEADAFGTFAIVIRYP